MSHADDADGADAKCEPSFRLIGVNGCPHRSPRQHGRGPAVKLRSIRPAREQCSRCLRNSRVTLSPSFVVIIDEGGSAKFISAYSRICIEWVGDGQHRPEIRLPCDERKTRQLAGGMPSIFCVLPTGNSGTVSAAAQFPTASRMVVGAICDSGIASHVGFE
jgi:hypothetical protein